MTKYVVLGYNDGEGRYWWAEIAMVEAADAKAAIKAAIETSGSASYATYVAVPARSWHPVGVEVTTVPQVRIVDKTAEMPA